MVVLLVAYGVGLSSASVDGRLTREWKGLVSNWLRSAAGASSGRATDEKVLEAFLPPHRQRLLCVRRKCLVLGYVLRAKRCRQRGRSGLRRRLASRRQRRLWFRTLGL